jgi:hypothetical protein
MQPRQHVRPTTKRLRIEPTAAPGGAWSTVKIEDVDYDTDPEVVEAAAAERGCAFADAVLQMKGYEEMVEHLQNMDDAVEAIHLINKEMDQASKLTDPISKLYVRKLVELKKETPNLLSVPFPVSTPVGTLYHQVSDTQFVEVR